MGQRVAIDLLVTGMCMCVCGGQDNVGLSWLSILVDSQSWNCHQEP
jgi:hypothetical protein